MNISSINFTPFKASGQAMFGSTTQREWQRYYPGNDDGTCNWALRSLLITEGNDSILIDSGFAPEFPEVFEEYKIENYKSAPEILAFQSIENLFVTHIIHTHLHVDHCGGSFNNSNGIIEPAFPKALYIASQQQLTVAQLPEEIERSSFQPEIIKAFSELPNLQLINNEVFIKHWLELQLFNGHTKGLIVPIIHFNKQSIAFVGDLIPSAAHLILNSASAYDMNPLLCLAEREEFLEEAFENDYLIVFQHDKLNECCKLKRENGKVVPDYFCTLDAVLNQ